MIKIGNKLGKLTIVKIHRDFRYTKWVECKCDCGNTIIVKLEKLKKRKDLSCKHCGEEIEKRKTEIDSIKKNIFTRWKSMKARCKYSKSENNKTYKQKNITICDEWLNNFDSFYKWALANGYKKELTIDRIDNNKGYCPSNCRWITQKENNRNRSINVFVIIKNKKMCMKEACETLGLNYDTCKKRYERGMSVEKALYLI